MAEANESSNAHLDQSPSPDQFVSREQFDALTEEHEKLKTECERLSAENALLMQNAESVRSHRERDLGETAVDSNLVNPELANALAMINFLKTQLEVLIEAVERKDFRTAELEVKIFDLTREFQRAEEQLRQETESNVQNELRLEENEAKRTELRRKCNGLFRQVEELNIQLQQSEEGISLLRCDIADLHIELEDRETRIDTMTESAERNSSRATERIRVLTDQNAELAEQLAEERSDRDGIEADRDRLAVLNEENMASRQQTERNLSTATGEIRVLTGQNAELAEELAEERSDREGIEAEIDRLANVDNENMALRRQIGQGRRTRERDQVIRNLVNMIARRALQIMHPVALHDVDEIPNNLG